MKKRILSTLLAISLCFGLLVVPTESRVLAKESKNSINLYEFKGYIEDSSLRTISKSYGALDKSVWNSFSNDYFYKKMNSAQKAFYDRLKVQTEDFFYGEKDANSFKVTGGEILQGIGKGVSYSGLSTEEASDIVQIFANANPQYYFISNTHAFDSKEFYICCFSEYAKAFERKAFNQRFLDVVNSYLTDIKRYSDKKEERQKRIHTLVSERITYATKESTEWGPHQSTATAVFTGKTVCAGYSELYALLCNAIDIPCICITSTNPNHEWNMVNYGDYWYCVDITHDDTDDYRSPLWKYYNQPMSPYFEDAYHNPDPIYKKLGIPEAKYEFGEKPLGALEGSVYRVYNRNSGEHFFTINEAEKNSLVNGGWQYEGVGFVSDVEIKSMPLYRLYNPNTSEHYYTLNEVEKEFLKKQGWRYEGIAFYSDPNQRVPVYILHNPYSKNAGSHHYTKNYAEVEFLVKQGWNYQKIGWYACE